MRIVEVVDKCEDELIEVDEYFEVDEHLMFLLPIVVAAH